MSEGCEPLISRQDAPSRYRIGCVARRVTLPRERFSPLTPERTRRGHAKIDANDPSRASFDLDQQEQFVVRRECKVVVAATDAQRSAADGIA